MFIRDDENVICVRFIFRMSTTFTRYSHIRTQWIKNHL